MEMHKNNCREPLARINGRTLKDALDKTKARSRFGNIHPKRWVDICPLCDAYALGIETNHPWPFLSADGVMRTAADFNDNGIKADCESLDFCGFTFSKSALNSAMTLIQLEDKATKEVERQGGSIAQNSDADLSLKFSQSVCNWGRGQRVWANLVRRNNQESLGKSLNDWFRIVADTNNNVEEAISPSVKIDGLGISFASKHLRMIAPQRYAVLDEVLSTGLGFALNVKGYRLFMQSLNDFKLKYNLEHNLATIESGIFSLVRQQVRIE
jgi:hypothetical protein